jgi:heme oxygenase
MRAQRETEESAITRIRQATAESHQRLEALIESLGMLRDLQGFGGHLARLYRHCAAHYALLAAYPDLQKLVGERRDELLADLQGLGRQPPAVQPRAHTPFTRAQCFGFTYVMEGSRLGALAIAKRLSNEGAPIEGLQSLSRTPAATRQRWFSFCERLSELPADEWDEAAATALDGFRALTQAHLGSDPDANIDAG